MNLESVKKGVRGIKNYLAHKEILNLPGYPLPETASHKIRFTKKSQVKKYYATTGGMILSKVEVGSQIKMGQLLYQLLRFNKSGELPTLIDIYAESDGLVYDGSTNHSVNEGEYILGVI